MARRFQSTRGGFSLYWQIHVEGASVVTEWGEVHEPRRAHLRRKGCGTLERATEELDRLVRDRVALGWVEAEPVFSGGLSGAARGGPVEVDLRAYASGEEGVPLGPGTPEVVSAEEVSAPSDDDLPTAALELHRAECRSLVERWVRDAAPVPVRLLSAVWVDPDWRAALLQVAAVASDGEGRTTGLLSDVNEDRFALLTEGGELRWLTLATVILAERGEADV